MITGISTVCATLVILFTAIFAACQLREISKSRRFTSFMNLSQFLQRDETRKARGILIALSGKDFKDWSQEEIGQAEKACSTYDVAGIAVCKNLIEKDLVVDEWRDSLIKCWEAAKPLIMKYRKTRGKDFWNDFEELYEAAKKIEVPHNRV